MNKNLGGILLISIILCLSACNSATKSKAPKPGKRKKVEVVEHEKKKIENKLGVQKKFTNEKEKIKSKLKEFQHIYLQKNLIIQENLKYLFSSNKNIEVIYGCAEKPHTVGWCRGYDEVKDMMLKDTECWNRIELDYDNTFIDIDHNTAWVSTMGVSELTPQYLEKFKKFTSDVTKSIENDGQVDNSIAPSVLKVMMDILYVKSKEGKLELPFVLTIVYVKEKGEWLIRQMHFSYPIDPRGLDDISKIQAI